MNLNEGNLSPNIQTEMKPHYAIVTGYSSQKTQLGSVWLLKFTLHLPELKFSALYIYLKSNAALDSRYISTGG